MAKRALLVTEGFVAAPPDDLCLAFANTRSWRGSAKPSEDLQGLEGVVAWAGSEGGVSPNLLEPMRAHWGAHPQEAEAAFAAALALRESLYRGFAAISAGRAPVPDDLRAVNAALGAAPARSRLRRHEGRYVWEVAEARPDVATLLASVAWSAGDLLAGARLGRVRQCANPACLWLFLDDSKSGNRRWCSMASCGNRAKAHRHYLKRKGKSPDSSQA